MSTISPGVMIDGRYRVISRLGAGGMADVFLAHDEQLGRNVALKLLHARFAEDPGFVERFRREAQSAASLQHPNVVSVYDRGSFDGTYYIAMEYLPGRSLKALIRQQAPLDPLRAIDLTLQILKAARFAHRRGVIHRDLKPHNVIVDENDQAKVTDFGIARAGASDMTETGSIMGTAQYLSPEQAQGHPVSESSDLYSIGIILYELLTGVLPFDAESAVTIALKHVSEAPPPPRQFNPDIPAPLEQVVLWALNKNPADRPADADQFISVLEQVRDAIASGVPGQATASMAAVAAGGAVGAGAGGAGGAGPGGAELGAVGLAAGAAGLGAGAALGAGAGGAGAAAGGGGALGNGGGGAAAAGAGPGTANGAGGGAPGDRDGSSEERGRRAWPWIAALVVLLALGGGAAAYLLTRPHLATVPAVVGYPESEGETIIQNRGFTASVLEGTSGKPVGTIIHQNPDGGVREDTGSTVQITVSSGPGQVDIPSVVSLSQPAAEKALHHDGLKVSRVVPRSSSTVSAGEAIGTDPGSGTSVQRGTAVTLYVSTGKPDVSVPGVKGETESAAVAAINSAGLQPSVTKQTSSSASPGTVISQAPAGGTQVRPGSAVVIVVATKAPTTPRATVPDVVGDTASNAESALSAAGFNYSVKYKKVKLSSESGVVLRQYPKKGKADKGSTVTITVGQYKHKGSGTTGTTGTSGTTGTTGGTTGTTTGVGAPTTPTTPSAT